MKYLNRLCLNTLRVARRNYEGARKYVIVNPLQGKHLPVRAEDALAMMRQLGRLVREAFPGERLLCVGFAETATAIGAAVAEICACDYIHTTREHTDIDNGFAFSETHSRWTEQKLRSIHWERLIRGVDRVVFIDDEISTGKTVRAIITRLEETGAVPRGVMRFAVGSIVNAMNTEDAALFEDAGIQEVHLVKVAKDGFDSEASAAQPDLSRLFDAEDLPEPDRGDFAFFEIGGKEDPRNGVSIQRYINACAGFAEELSATLVLGRDTRRVLILGTEEFMFPALYAARFIERANPGLAVYTHATTRSPIAPSSHAGYPIFAAYRLRSAYDRECETFVYNLAPYDHAVIVTDSEMDSQALIEVLGGVHKSLAFVGTKQVTAFRWHAKRV